MHPQRRTDLFVLLFLGLWVAAMLVLGQTVGAATPWHQNWYRWDADSYQAIWDLGYAAKTHLIAFPPLFPLLAGSISALSTWPFGVSAMLVNVAALLGAGWVLSRILRDSFELPGAWASLLIACSPALYFALAPYSDALFLYVFLHASWLLTRPAHQLSRGDHALLLILLFCAPLVRITGVIFAPLVLAGRWHALATGAGGMVWMAINYSVTGSATAFMGVQAAFGMPEGTLIDGLRGCWNGLWFVPGNINGFTSWVQLHLMPMSILLCFVATAVWLAVRRQWLWLYLLTAVLMVSHNQAFWRSVVRYDLLIWPFLFLPWLHIWKRLNTSAAPSIGTALPVLLLSLIMLFGWITQFANVHLFLRGGWTF